MDITSILIAAIPVIGEIALLVITNATRKTAKKTTTAVTDLMRNEITKLYYKRQSIKQLYEYERESLDKMYEGYHEAGGNSFIDDIYNQMRKWDVVGAGKKIGGQL